MRRVFVPGAARARRARDLRVPDECATCALKGVNADGLRWSKCGNGQNASVCVSGHPSFQIQGSIRIVRDAAGLPEGISYFVGEACE